MLRALEVVVGFDNDVQSWWFVTILRGPFLLTALVWVLLEREMLRSSINRDLMG